MLRSSRRTNSIFSSNIDADIPLPNNDEEVEEERLFRVGTESSSNSSTKSPAAESRLFGCTLPTNTAAALSEKEDAHSIIYTIAFLGLVLSLLLYFGFLIFLAVSLIFLVIFPFF